MKRRLPALLWTRPNSAVEWTFVGLIGFMMLASLGWLIFGADSETRESFSKYLAILGGDTETRVRTPDYAAGGLYLSAWAWLLASGFLWLTRGWWLSPLPTQYLSPLRFDRVFLIGLGILVLVALGIRWPRMELSLYNDELDVFRTSIVGGYQKGIFDEIHNDALPEFRPVPWQETVWGNRIGNNHSLHSILARLGHQAWQDVHDAPLRQVFEVPLRLPSLFGGLLSVLAVGFLGRLLTGSSRAAWFAAFLVAIHPWHLRYSTEARGYGLVFGFSTLALLFLLLAVERGRWRWWFAFGVSQSLTLWACIGSLHLIVAMNLVAASIFLWWQWQRRQGNLDLESPKVRAFPRWVAISGVSAAFYLLAAAPLIPPIKLAIATNPTFSAGVPAGWELNTLAYFLFGMPWQGSDAENPLIVSVSTMIRHPGFLIGATVALTLVLSGAFWLIRRGPLAGLFVVLMPALAVVIQWTGSKVGGSTLLPWYANYGTVFVALWMGVGLWALIYRPRDESTEDSRGRDRKTWQRFAAYGLLALYLLAIFRPLTIYRAHGKQALREAVVHVRGGTFPFTEAQQEPLVATWWTHVNFYDPHVRIAYQPETLQAMIDRARNEARPLYYILGARPIARREDPRMLERLEESGDFSFEGKYPGLENPQFSLWIYRLNPPKTP